MKRTRLCLPADSVICAAASIRSDTNKIYQNLTLLQLCGNIQEFLGAIADDDGLGSVDRFLDRWLHQRGYVRYRVHDVITVGAGERSQLHVLVVEANVVSLADQVFD